jgi:hypothetical protein
LKRIIITLGAALLLALLAVPGAALARGHHRASADRNHDRLPDTWERRHHLSLRVNQAKRDQDRDGLNNLNEFRSGTDPRDADTDNDGIDDANEDRDHDGVDNGNEQDEHTNPAVRDTNHNGRADGREDADHDGLNNKGEDVTGNNPENRDTDGDGIPDGRENAGTVKSFDGTTLIITLGNGQDVMGTVNADTRVTCEGEREHEIEQDEGDTPPTAQTSRDGGENSGPGGGDNSGPGGDDGDHTVAGDDDHGRRGHDGEHETNCSTADLTPGTPVHEARADATSTGLVFEEVELVKDAPPAPGA